MTRRGQTLVLMSVSLLVVTVLIVMTVAIGQKARDKVELQTMADTAAYSNAVATARAFNTFSLLNRVSISHWVSLAGTQALIAWTRSYRAMFGGMSHQLSTLSAQLSAQAAAAMVGNVCTPRCQCLRREAAAVGADAATLRGQMDNLINNRVTAAPPRNLSRYTALDRSAALEAQHIQQSVVRMEILESKVYSELFWDVLMTGRYTKQALATAGGGQAPAELAIGASTACRDVCHATHDDDMNGDTFNDVSQAEMNSAWLGSRGWEFTVFGTDHGTMVVPSALVEDLGWWQTHLSAPGRYTFNERAILSCTYGSDSSKFTYATPLPAGYLQMDGLDPAHRGWVAMAADRHDLPVATYQSTCMAFSPSATSDDGAIVISSNLEDLRDYLLDSADAVRTNPAHTLGPSGTFIPDDLSQSPSFRATHPNNLKHGALFFRGGYGLIHVNRYPPANGVVPLGKPDVWGLPKLPVLLYRDKSLRPQPDPWEQGFSMQLDKSKPAAKVDFQGASPTFGGNADYQLQSAIASGMAYYHRRGHLEEPANMLNPYWRATLVPMDINRNGQPSKDSLAHQAQFLDPNHATQLAQGWEAGDVALMYSYGFGDNTRLFPGRTAPAWIEVYEKLVNDGNFKGIH